MAVLSTNGIEWKTSRNREVYNVKRIKNKNGSWNVEVKKGKSLAELRKVNRLCIEGETLNQAIQHSKTVLQGIVIGKEN